MHALDKSCHAKHYRDDMSLEAKDAATPNVDTAMTPHNEPAYAALIHQGDYKSAIPLMTEAANKGDVIAQSELANVYFYGHGVDVQRNYDAAFSWCVRAAEQDNNFAQGLLGAMYLKGKGVGQDLQKAIQWLTKAVENPDYTVAYHNLGCAYLDADQPEQAIKYLSSPKLVDVGYAQYALATAYRRCKMHDQAIVCFQRSADAKFYKSYVRLAEIATERKEYMEALRYWHAAHQHDACTSKKLNRFYDSHRAELIPIALTNHEQIKQLTEENRHLRLYPGTDFEAAMRDFRMLAGHPQQQQHPYADMDSSGPL